jgi:protein phosphatase
MQKAFGHVLTRAVGTHEAVKIDISEYPLEIGDTIVISSDGLSNKVSENEIWATVRGYRPEQACQSLVDLANRRGGDDNVTVIVLNVQDR